MTLLIASLTLALGVSALCSLLEAALLSYSPSQVATLSMKRPRLGRVWARFKKNIEKPISVILVLNTTAHTIGATMAGAQFEKLFGADSLIVFSLVFTFVMLQFTEILPKSLGVRYNGVLAPIIAPPLAFMVRIMGPFLALIHLINRPFEGRGDHKDKTLEEIGALAASARLGHLIDSQQARMIKAASDIREICVRQVMTPRSEVSYLDADTPVSEAFALVQQSSYTRLPLCEGGIDKTIGMVHVKDILMCLRPSRSPGTGDGGEQTGGTVVCDSTTLDLREIQREILALPEQLSIFEALRRFQAKRLHMGIVVDEHGATVGIVTLEDVLEEVVGDITDEFDPTEPDLIRKEGAGFRVDARMPLHHLVYHIPDLGIDAMDPEVDTVGGFATKSLGRIPARNDSFSAGPYTWTVIHADERRVKEVRIAQTKAETQPEA